jgi:hypothetical protein
LSAAGLPDFVLDAREPVECGEVASRQIEFHARFLVILADDKNKKRSKYVYTVSLNRSALLFALNIPC